MGKFTECCYGDVSENEQHPKNHCGEQWQRAPLVSKQPVSNKWKWRAGEKCYCNGKSSFRIHKRERIWTLSHHLSPRIHLTRELYFSPPCCITFGGSTPKKNNLCKPIHGMHSLIISPAIPKETNMVNSNSELAMDNTTKQIWRKEYH